MAWYGQGRRGEERRGEVTRDDRSRGGPVVCSPVMSPTCNLLISIGWLIFLTYYYCTVHTPYSRDFAPRNDRTL
jgi:hypothetical protein